MGRCEKKVIRVRVKVSRARKKVRWVTISKDKSKVTDLKRFSLFLVLKAIRVAKIRGLDQDKFNKMVVDKLDAVVSQSSSEEHKKLLRAYLFQALSVFIQSKHFKGRV